MNFCFYFTLHGARLQADCTYDGDGDWYCDSVWVHSKTGKLMCELEDFDCDFVQYEYDEEARDAIKNAKISIEESRLDYYGEI